MTSREIFGQSIPRTQTTLNQTYHNWEFTRHYILCQVPNFRALPVTNMMPLHFIQRKINMMKIPLKVIILNDVSVQFEMKHPVFLTYLLCCNHMFLYILFIDPYSTSRRFVLFFFFTKTLFTLTVQYLYLKYDNKIKNCLRKIFDSIKFSIYYI